MFGLHKGSSKKKFQREANFKSSSQNSLNVFDDFVPVQERLAQRRPHKMPNRRCKEQFKTSKGEADLKRKHFQFDVQQFCDNFVKGVDKALKDVSKSQKKSTPTRAPVAEPSIFISEKPKGKSENNLEDLKDFSDSLPIFDKYDEELMESWITCEDECDLPSPKPDLMFDIDNEETNGLTCFEPEHPSSLVLVSQVFEEEPLNYQHQGPRLGTRRPLDNDLSPIFDEEDELDPIFDEEAPSTSSIIIEKHLCFDPGTTSTPFPKKHLQDKYDQFPRRENTGERQSSYVSGTWNWKYLRKTSPKLQGTFYPYFSFIEFYMILKFVFSYSFPFDRGEMDLRSNPFQEGGNDVPWGSAPGKIGMHGLIMESSKDICSLFDSYLTNHEASTHEITWRMVSTQLRSSLKKNQIKLSSYVIVMLFTNQVIFSSREFRPPEKLEIANLLSDEPTVNSIMKKVIIHFLNVQESIGLDGFQKDSKTNLFGPNGETDKYWLKEKMDFDQASKGHVLAHIRSIFFTFQSRGRGYMKR
ncbi:unnamed protein product [Brassica oleracea]